MSADPKMVADMFGIITITYGGIIINICNIILNTPNWEQHYPRVIIENLVENLVMLILKNIHFHGSSKRNGSLST